MLGAGTGEEGLALLAEHGADLVLLDVMMPGMSGWEVCRRIKANPATAKIPVVILTVRDMQKEDEAQFAACAEAYINKPFHHTELRQIVARLLVAAPHD